MKKLLFFLLSFQLVLSGCESNKQEEFLNTASAYIGMIKDYTAYAPDPSYSVKKFKELQSDVDNLNVPDGYEKGEELKQELLILIDKNIKWSEWRFEQSKKPEDNVTKVAYHIIKNTNTIEVEKIIQNINDEIEKTKLR
ncbi:MAG: hypothetical protein UZ04_CHB001001476 [Chlorobi bacterium OLB4]|jgi:hypothetical protein|nr:MAG: hypothetical protein UZ04_CHB001001476 [Chlorobi bacterium OLB4]MBV6399566.1 hypothetical protein [Ignavibacteria bacterium]RIK47810.1 MAG: hypothetical protein DCC60_09560 [Ignavibacteriota bacterium]